MRDELAERLEFERRRYVVSVGELQDMARKLTELGRLLEVSPDRVAVSTDRKSLEFLMDW